MSARDLAFWAAVALVAIASNVLIKVIASKVPSEAFQQFAAAS